MHFELWSPHAHSVALVTFADPISPSPSADNPSNESSEVACTEAAVIPLHLADERWSVDVDLPPATQYVFRLTTPTGIFDRLDPRGREATGSVGRSVVVDSHFDWTDDNFTPLPLPHWVIYELHAGTFAGSLDGVTTHLDELADLGVTALELMPLGEFSGDQSWGYNPSLPYAVESSLGGPDALKRLVNEAHARGIAVLLDLVYNHFGPQDLDLWRYDGWYENDGGGIYFYNDWRSETTMDDPKFAGTSLTTSGCGYRSTTSMGFELTQR
jgi:1,4-alpha-glucan branching enzyme